MEVFSGLGLSRPGAARERLWLLERLRCHLFLCENDPGAHGDVGVDRREDAASFAGELRGRPPR